MNGPSLIESRPATIAVVVFLLLAVSLIAGAL